MSHPRDPDTTSTPREIYEVVLTTYSQINPSMPSACKYCGTGMMRTTNDPKQVNATRRASGAACPPLACAPRACWLLSCLPCPNLQPVDWTEDDPRVVSALPAHTIRCVDGTQCSGGKHHRCRPGMDNKFIAPGSQTSNAWCCICAKERHAWHEFDRFACRHCVKRDKSRPAKTVATPPEQKLRCASTLPLVGRNSAAVAEPAAVVIPAACQLDAASGERGVVLRGERLATGLVGTSTEGHAALCDVDFFTQVGGEERRRKGDRDEAPPGKGCAAACCCS